MWGRTASLAAEVESLAQQCGPNCAVWKRLQQVEKQVVALSEDVRRMAHQLHPSILDDLGLAAVALAGSGCLTELGIREFWVS